MKANGVNISLEAVSPSATHRGCPVEFALQLIRGKWKKRIIYLIAERELRFSEILKNLEEISQPVLARELRELESSNLIKRVVYQQVPLRVGYSLTSVGESLLPILIDLKRWGEEYIEISL
ncbi:helix-turn-helix domain-containing protein [Acetobacter sp. P5B1]|uniref:winged helix-turn-helix transcriptional regulator n=1 Tax=Acetobacter sp. P5B1 TaxID=2762620 RepID=UPI001C045965|nr:helix-turn-helix domain-containing protein [Acetobacter sp. P5B1]